MQTKTKQITFSHVFRENAWKMQTERTHGDSREGKTGARNREKHHKCNKKQTNRNPFHLGNNNI